MFLLLHYMLNVIGDLTIIALTLLDSHIKIPVCIFLHNFLFLEISFTSSCIPRFLITTVTREKMISYIGCMSQLFFYIFLGVTEFSLLAASPMTTMLPFASLCIIHPSWAAQSVISWYSVLGQLASWSLSLHQFLVFTWISVIQISLTISFVIFLLSYNFLSWTHIY